MTSARLPIIITVSRRITGPLTPSTSGCVPAASHMTFPRMSQQLCVNVVHTGRYTCRLLSVTMVTVLSHRWWPAQVIPDRRVPNTLRPSKPAACTFLVKFFGTEQYFWTHHGRVLAFNEDCVPTEQASGKKRLHTITKNTKQDQIKEQYTQGKPHCNAWVVCVLIIAYSYRGSHGLL